MQKSRIQAKSEGGKTLLKHCPSQKPAKPPLFRGSLKQNSDKRVLLMNGEDIRAVLTEAIPLVDLLRAKVQALSLDSEPFVSAAEALT